MECSCSVGLYDGDGGESHWGVQHRKAAKQHRCCECHGVINKGEYYWYHTVFYDGTVSNYKICEACDCIIHTFFDNGWYYGMVIEELKEYLHDGWSEDLPSSCIVKLVPKARDMVCDFLQRFQEGGE